MCPSPDRSSPCRREHLFLPERPTSVLQSLRKTSVPPCATRATGCGESPSHSSHYLPWRSCFDANRSLVWRRHPPRFQCVARALTQCAARPDNALVLSILTHSPPHLPAHPDCPASSTGIITARLVEPKPEKDRLKRIAQDWYAWAVA